MKKYLQQFLLIIPLILLGGIVAAYSGPGSTAPNGNTDAPIDITSDSQAKSGGLSVNAFQSQNGSAFNTFVAGAGQKPTQTFFNGIVRGGTVNDKDSTVNFGDSTHGVGITAFGTLATQGSLYSNSLKSPSGQTPLCAGTDGTFKMCTAAVAPGQTPIYINTRTVDRFAGYKAVAVYTTENTGYRITAQVTAQLSHGSNGGLASVVKEKLALVKDMFVAHAIKKEEYGPVDPTDGPGDQDNCPYNFETPTDLDTTFIIPAGSSESTTATLIPVNCDKKGYIVYRVKSFSPETIEGREIRALQS